MTDERMKGSSSGPISSHDRAGWISHPREYDPIAERAGDSVAGDDRKGHALSEVQDFDLLFLDILLPDMDGLETRRIVYKPHRPPAQEAREAVSTIRMRSAAFLAPSFFMILAR